MAAKDVVQMAANALDNIRARSDAEWAPRILAYRESQAWWLDHGAFWLKDPAALTDDEIRHDIMATSSTCMLFSLPEWRYGHIRRIADRLHRCARKLQPDAAMAIAVDEFNSLQHYQPTHA